MFTQGIEAVLSRAISDTSFEENLFAERERVLSAFELTREEAELFMEMSREDLRYYKMAALEARLSFGLATNHNEHILQVCDEERSAQKCLKKESRTFSPVP